MEIIAVANQKGGCGKTTTAINLAAALASMGRRTLLIDLDPQAHATLGLNLKPERTIYDCLTRLGKERPSLSEVILNICPNLDMAPSHILLSTIEQELADEIGRESLLKEVIVSSALAYEYILIDCPPSLGILTVNAICAAGEIMIPVQTSRFSLEGLKKLLDIISIIQERLAHRVHYQVLVTMFDSRLQHSFRMLTRMREEFGGHLFRTIIHTNVRLQESISEGVSILAFDKYCRGAKDYQSLARELLGLSSMVQDAAAFKEKMLGPVVVKFSLDAPHAREVYVVGDFNAWKTEEASRLEKNGGGWQKSMRLEPGRYRYRFVVDGSWQDDPQNPLWEANPFGEKNSIIEIMCSGS